MSDRQDFALQCASDAGGISEEQLAKAWCDRCVRVECTRSSLGRENRFEGRVLNWHERLFTNPARMPPNDPRFLPIARQGFLTIDMGPAPTIRSTPTWHDPRDLQPEPGPSPSAFVEPTQTAHVVPNAPSVQVAPEPAVQAASMPVQTAPVAPQPPVSTQSVPHPASRPSPQRPRAPLNAPNAQGRMIDRPLSAPTLPPIADPWSGAVKPASNPNEVIVQRGAKIKLG